MNQTKEVKDLCDKDFRPLKKGPARWLSGLKALDIQPEDLSLFSEMRMVEGKKPSQVVL